MTYREAAMLEAKEVLRLSLGGVRKKRIAGRRYLRAAQTHALMSAANRDELERQLAGRSCQRRSPGNGSPMVTNGPRPWLTAGSSSGSCAPTCHGPRSACCSGIRA